jgi:hypothetical protein
VEARLVRRQRGPGLDVRFLASQQVSKGKMLQTDSLPVAIPPLSRMGAINHSVIGFSATRKGLVQTYEAISSEEEEEEDVDETEAGKSFRDTHSLARSLGAASQLALRLFYFGGEVLCSLLYRTIRWGQMGHTCIYARPSTIYCAFIIIKQHPSGPHHPSDPRHRFLLLRYAPLRHKLTR